MHPMKLYALSRTLRYLEGRESMDTMKRGIVPRLMVVALAFASIALCAGVASARDFAEYRSFWDGGRDIPSEDDDPTQLDQEGPESADPDVALGTWGGIAGGAPTWTTAGVSVGSSAAPPDAWMMRVQGGGNALSSSNVNISELNTVFRRSSDVTANATGIGFAHSSNSTSVGAAIIHERTGSQSQGKLHFATKSATTAGADIPIRMTIDQNGNVGVGRTAAGLFPGAARYLTLSASNSYVAGMTASLELQGSSIALGVPVARIDFSSVFASSNNIARIQAERSGSVTEGELAFFTHDGTSLNEAMRIDENANLGIGTSTIPSGYKVAIDGKLICEEVKVELSVAWPDHVLEDTYQLTPLTELEEQIKRDRHLPGMPTAAEVSSSGISLGVMQAKLLQKVEELTLYLIELKRENQALEAEVTLLRNATH